MTRRVSSYTFACRHAARLDDAVAAKIRDALARPQIVDILHTLDGPRATRSSNPSPASSTLRATSS
jgi:hypothetical protein